MSAVDTARVLKHLASAGASPNFENMLEASYRKLIKPGHTVVDIGAHSGRHTVVFAELVGPAGQVHAFEPLPVAVGWLRGRGLPTNVRIHELAVSEKTGVAEFVFAAGSPEESGLKQKSYNKPDSVTPERIKVQTAPLDSFVSEIKPHFIKIDAEGAEIGCLVSGQKMIAASRTWITVEYGYPGYSAFGLTQSSLFDRATAMGYTLGDLYGNLITTAANWHLVCDRGAWDWYMIPNERVSEWVSALY